MILVFLLWLSRLRTQHCLYEDASSILGLSSLRLHPALLQDAVQLADEAQIRCIIGFSGSSNLTPSLGTSICHRCGCKKKKKMIAMNDFTARFFFLFHRLLSEDKELCSAFLVYMTRKNLRSNSTYSWVIMFGCCCLCVCVYVINQFTSSPA